jgi:hypothetical protein
VISSIVGHFRSHAVAYLALLVAMGGTAYAANHHQKINGRRILKNSIPGNRVKVGTLPGTGLKTDTVTGQQVNESSLAEVPRAARAGTAGTADDARTAKTAEDANALGGIARSGFGPGIVSGGVVNVKNGVNDFPPYGIYNTEDPYDYSIEAIAPVDMTIRDFVGAAVFGFNNAEDKVTFELEIFDPANGFSTVALCLVNSDALTCSAAGPIALKQGDKYRLQTVGANLPAAPSKIVVGFQYRAAAN